MVIKFWLLEQYEGREIFFKKQFQLQHQQFLHLCKFSISFKVAPSVKSIYQQIENYLSRDVFCSILTIFDTHFQELI